MRRLLSEIRQLVFRHQDAPGKPEHEAVIERIISAPGVIVNEIRETPILCIGCGISLGFVAMKISAPKHGSFAFQTRFACEDCGQKAATLDLMGPKGNA